MTTLDREMIEHEIGTDGSLTIRGHDGPVELRAVDGTTARIHGSGPRPLEDDYRILQAPGSLELTAITSWQLRMLRGERRCQAIQVTLPRGTRVRVETASGDVRAVGIAGDQRYRTVSGDVDVETPGRVDLETVSGDARLRSATLLAQARTVSGDLDVAAPTIVALQARTTSGDMTVAGSFDGAGPFALETVSGNVAVRPVGPLRVEGTTVTGDVRSSLPHRSGGSVGRRTIELGEGGPVVGFRSISGDLRVDADRDRPAVPDVPAMPAAAEAPNAPDAPAPGVTPVASASPVDDREEDRLAILRELEAGTIGVAEAGRRLSELDAPPRSASPGEFEQDGGPGTGAGAGVDRRLCLGATCLTRSRTSCEWSLTAGSARPRRSRSWPRSTPRDAVTTRTARLARRPDRAATPRRRVGRSASRSPTAVGSRSSSASRHRSGT